MKTPERLKQIKETCLYVKDLDRTGDFYHGILGLEVISKVANRHIFFRVGSDVLLCFIAEATAKDPNMPPHFGEGQLHFAMECSQDSYVNWKSYLVEKGIAIEKEVDWKNNRYSFYFRDPDMHCVEIIMPGVWE